MIAPRHSKLKPEPGREHERKQRRCLKCRKLFMSDWLTNAFSKKVENHAHAVALHFMYYNFVRIHQSLRETPAMAAKVTDRLWEIEDIVRIADEYEDQKKVA